MSDGPWRGYRAVWDRNDRTAYECGLCTGEIAPHEPRFFGYAGNACLSCILTAVQSILPGAPPKSDPTRRIEVRYVGYRGHPRVNLTNPVTKNDYRYPADKEDERGYSVTVTAFGKMYQSQAAWIAVGISEPEQVAALLAVVRDLLAGQDEFATQEAPLPELAANAWQPPLDPPIGERLIAWVVGPKTEPERDDGDGGTEDWLQAVFKLPEFTPWGSRTENEDEPVDPLRWPDFKPVWHFADPVTHLLVEPNPDLTVLAWRRGPDRPAFLRTVVP